MNYRSKIIVAIAVGLVTFGIVPPARAAVISLTPSNSEIGVGEKVTIELRIDSEGVSFNAAQAVIRFPKNMLEVTGLDSSGSAFSFWLEEPNFSNTDGIISFTGGTPYGVSGDAIGILKIQFKATGTGSGMLSLTESAITAADGSGTNILRKMNDAVIAIVPQRVVPNVPEPQQNVPEPEQITREPVASKKMPAAPVLQVPLYPEEDRWYNLVAQFTARWDLPLDVAGVSTAITKDPNAAAPQRSEGLFDNKTFPSLSDGVWYLHVRFRNNIGWGPTAHYRLAVDTQPPLGFELTVLGGEKTDNPTPALSFGTSDALSGISHYEIRANDEAPIIASGSSYTFTPHPPGTYLIAVRAYDYAGNSVENKTNIEILPIESPAILFLTKSIIIGTDNMLTMRGTALPDVGVVVTLENEDHDLVLQDETRANAQGEWGFSLEKELRRGTYLVSVRAKDIRGALSDLTDPVKIAVSEKPVISLFGLDITFRGLLILLVLAIFCSVGWFYRKTILRLARSQRESIIISRDLKNAFTMIEKHLATIGGIVKKNAPAETRDLEFQVAKKQITDILDTVSKYISGDIEQLK